MSNDKISASFTFIPILTLIFITLKFTNYITWSWWWVLSPMWMIFPILAVIFVVIFIFITIKSLIEVHNL